MEKKDMPLGFAFRMGLNEKAQENFSKMTDEEKRQVLDAARMISSKSQMQNLVDDLGKLS